MALWRNSFSDLSVSYSSIEVSLVGIITRVYNFFHTCNTNVGVKNKCKMKYEYDNSCTLYLCMCVCVCVLVGGNVHQQLRLAWRIKLKNYVYIINQSFIMRLQIMCYGTQYTDFTQAFVSYWTDRADMYVTFLTGNGLRYITLHYNNKSWVTMYTAYLTGTLSLHYLLCVAGWEGRDSLRQRTTKTESGR